MSIFKLLTATTLAASVLLAMSSTAHAQQSRTITETVCDTAGYGQQNCRQVSREVSIPEHKPLDTALDTSTQLMLMAVLGMGLTAVALKKKVAAQ